MKKLKKEVVMENNSDKELLITLVKIGNLLDKTGTDIKELSIMVDEFGNLYKEILEEVSDEKQS